MWRAPIIALATFLLFGCQTTPPQTTEVAPRADDACAVTRVIDGDTVDMRCAGTAVFRARLTGFDTPEIFSPRCSAEKRLGLSGKARLAQLVAQARSLDAVLGRYDRYGRRLVRLSLDGTDVAQTLVSEGYAVRYNGGRRIDWCGILS